MKLKQKKNSKITLSDKIADALTLKPRADIEDDQVFGTKPQTLSRADFGSSDSEDEAAISDFRKRNVNLLSEVSKKYEGQVVSRRDIKPDSDVSYEDDSDDELPLNGEGKDSNSKVHSNLQSESEIESDEETNYITQFKKQIQASDDDSSDNDDQNGENDDRIKHFKKQIQESDDSDDDNKGDDRVTQFKKQIQASDNDSSDNDDQNGENDDRIKHFKKQIQESDDSDEGNKGDDRVTQFKKQIQASDDESDDDNESDDYSINQSKKQDEASDEESDDNDGYDISQLEEPMKEDFEHVKKQNVSEEAKKGNCVRNELLLWEGLLEMRIHLQRCVSTANQMPMPETYTKLQLEKDFAEESNTTKANVANVLDKLLSLQNLLLNNFPETKSLSSKKATKQDAKVESDEEIPSDTDNEEIPSDTEPEDNIEEIKSPKLTKKVAQPVKKRKLADYESELSSTHKAFKTFRDTSIQKWNDKTRLATANNIKNAPTNTILQQITYILSDRNKLVRRTQLKRSEYDIIGYKKPLVESAENDENGSEVVMRGRKDDDEYIPEIFDDSDFYHQLLRELIECKSADISDPVQLSRQWIALQQMRSKMKRKVDTKATKGRKIKYVVHNKLMNYMAPEKCGRWTEESTNELYSSLFGKLFEQNNAGLNGNVGNIF